MNIQFAKSSRFSKFLSIESSILDLLNSENLANPALSVSLGRRRTVVSIDGEWDNRYMKNFRTKTNELEIL